MPASDPAINAAITAAVDDNIIPAVTRFNNASDLFNTQAAQFCQQIDVGNLETLQARWTDAYHEWFKLANYNFGPLDDDLIFPRHTFIDSLRLRGTNYLATVRGQISANLNGAATLNTDFFDNQTFQNVGLLALESAVFETSTPDHSNTAADIVAEYQTTPRKCDIVTGLAASLVGQADYISNGWTVAHRNSDFPYRLLFLANELDDGQTAIAQLLIGMQQHLEHLQSRNVATVSAPVSGQAWSGISRSVDEISNLLNANILTIMQNRGFQTAADTVRQNIDAINQAIDSRDPDLLEIELGKLDGNMKREIPDSLGVSLGFNFTDGD